MRKQIISLYDYTGEAVKPWAEAGYECFCYDIQHDADSWNTESFAGGGTISYIKLDLQETIKDNDGFEYYPFIFKLLRRHSYKAHMVLGFPVCTDLAVSGAGSFKRKAEDNPRFQIEATDHAKACEVLASLLEVPYMIENPVSRLATLWRKPNVCFQPYEYGAYIPEAEADHPLYPDYIAPRDAYSKKTCLWSGGGFVMPSPKPVDCESFGSSRQHRKLGGKSLRTKNIRSATPRGFARAVFEANKMEVK
jgi:hypothetical protein